MVSPNHRFMPSPEMSTRRLTNRTALPDNDVSSLCFVCVPYNDVAPLQVEKRFRAIFLVDIFPKLLLRRVGMELWCSQTPVSFIGHDLGRRVLSMRKKKKEENKNRYNF